VRASRDFASEYSGNNRPRGPTADSSLMRRGSGAGVADSVKSGSSPVGILFADVVASTTLYEALGDARAFAAVWTCLAIAQEEVTAKGGAVVKTIGDEIMAAFDDPAAMVEAAVAIMCRVDQQPAIPGPRGLIRLALRAGGSFGPAIYSDGDYFGDSVNMAARMTALAGAMEIIFTGETATCLPTSAQAMVRAIDPVFISGKTEEVRVIELLWQHTGATIFRPSGRHGGSKRERLELCLNDKTWVLEVGESVTLGREGDNDMIVPTEVASRHHATIGWRREKWVLTDHSTNGTFLATARGGPARRVHREQVELRRAGLIGCGAPPRAGGTTCIGFRLV
jgi:adenylate cyclase